MPEGGAYSVRRESRLMKLATKAAGRCVDARKVSRRRKKRERCFEWRILGSRREYSLW